jgi:flagellin|tara:strand:+ start:75048 stop:75854 length:807 start_codon:yes stop_codon:yes gene_type:complete
VAINSKAKLDKNLSDVERQNRSLATGDRIHEAAVDPSGLIISEGMRARIRSMGQAQRNATDSISLIQVAESGLSEIQNMAARLKELALQSANDTLGDEDRGRSNIEFQQLKREIKRIIRTSEFNGRKLLDGSGGKYQFQVGIHDNEGVDQVNYDMSRLLRSADQVSLSNGAITSKGSSMAMLPKIDKMLTEVSGARAFLGGIQNRVESTISNLQVSRVNTSAANSRIRDTDVAKATAEKAISQIKTDASTGFLGHANTLPGRVKQLIE